LSAMSAAAGVSVDGSCPDIDLEPRRRPEPVHRGEVTLVAHRVAKVGGMERAFAELAEGLLRRGVRVHIISHRCDLDPHPNLRVHRLRLPNRPFLVAYPLFAVLGSIATWRHRRGLLHTLGAIVFNRVDVATVQFCHHGFDVGAAHRRAQHSSALHRLNSRLAHLVGVAGEKFAYRRGRTRLLVPVSEGVGRELRRSFPAFADRMTVIPNGVDRRRFSSNAGDRTEVGGRIGAADSDLIAVFVGGDWERKGLRFAIEALAQCPAWRLLVVGAGPSHRYISLAAARGVERRVHFVGATSQPARYFGAADAFVLPTAYEAYPLVVLEAAACECPILVTPVNGAEEFVEEGINGFFIQRDAGSIAARLNQLEQLGAEGRQALGRAARGRTENFTWDHIVDAHLALYEGHSQRLHDGSASDERAGRVRPQTRS
jgi:glycosyltransferase involved in cell wall biosynthesis